MATNRPTLPDNSNLLTDSVTAGIAGTNATVHIAIHGITYTSSSLNIVYSAYTTKRGAATAVNNLYSKLDYTITDGSQSSSGSSINQSENANGAQRMVFSIATTFQVSSITLTLQAARFYALSDGDIVVTGSVTIPIREHPGGNIVFLTQNNLYLRLPTCNASNAGALYFLKNTTTTPISIVPSISQPSTTIESTSYTFNGYPQLRLQAYQCVGLLSNGTQWFVVLFYAGAGTGQGRNGYAPETTTEVAASDITSNIIYSSINSKDLRVNLPVPSSRQLLMIVAERTQDMFGYQLQLNQPASGTLIDGRWSELNLNITNNRHGNCAVFLISNGSTWYLASMFDMTDMDNFGTTALTTTAPVTSAIGINTSGAVTSNVWSGRSYDTMAVTPYPLSNGTAVFRIFKENNSAVSNGFGLKASDDSALFTNSFSGPNYSNNNSQMFSYGSNNLMAMFGLEIKRPGVANRIYFLGQYPTRF